jgi:predicted DNA-binding protein
MNSKNNVVDMEKHLKKILESKFIDAAKLADIIGAAVGTAVAKVTGRSEFNLKEIELLCEATGLTKEELFPSGLKFKKNNAYERSTIRRNFYIPKILLEEFVKLVEFTGRTKAGLIAQGLDMITDGNEVLRQNSEYQGEALQSNMSYANDERINELVRKFGGKREGVNRSMVISTAISKMLTKYGREIKNIEDIFCKKDVSNIKTKGYKLSPESRSELSDLSAKLGRTYSSIVIEAITDMSKEDVILYASITTVEDKSVKKSVHFEFDEYTYEKLNSLHDNTAVHKSKIVHAAIDKFKKKYE